ncbi:hypothetical protein ACJRO7_027427 [Eucalyptus globulus]|uniref:Uncharacterized protein n=1 Tax=Eucalyptus globulus TaxID=34317 RepID=A0ABD3JW44_EUCGL
MAVEYLVMNNADDTPDGMRFIDEIGILHSQQTLTMSTDFIWRTFQQIDLVDRKEVARVSLFIDNMDGVAYTSNNEIHVSAKYLGGLSGDVKGEFTGVLYHEMTHGIADFVRLLSGYVPGHWVQPGHGDRWDQGYDVTARFLDYCDGLRNGFVAELNKKMKTGFSDNYFVDLLAKTVDQLWSEYKAAYAN